MIYIDANSILYWLQAMYIRVKRHKTTYFVQCDPTDTALDIKQKLQSLVDQPTDNQRLTLCTSNTILEDSKTLAEQRVINTFDWRLESSCPIFGCSPTSRSSITRKKHNFKPQFSCLFLRRLKMMLLWL